METLIFYTKEWVIHTLDHNIQWWIFLVVCRILMFLRFHMWGRRDGEEKMILAFKVNIQGIYFVVISTQEPHFALENVCMGENNQFLYNVYWNEEI